MTAAAPRLAPLITEVPHWGREEAVVLVRADVLATMTLMRAR